jgi:hypothetical protein
MGSYTGWHLPCEYTVVENAKKEKNGKMDPKKCSKNQKSSKNRPKSSQNEKTGLVKPMKIQQPMKSATLNSSSKFLPTGHHLLVSLS